ncbi:hypothetical protein GCM10009759_79640 [Kitasatospora saccharophila]|uniref:Clp R domain-containing protein n=1 Tax=Kitasatospora saccharophila TaxID=407973 RepID=A0ABN2YI14_9ACTN
MPQLSDWLRLTVISRAQQEASERHHSHTDTGHLLLALLASSGSSFDSVLADQGTTAEAVRCAVEERWSAGATDGTRWWGFPVPVGELPPLSTEAGEAVRQTDRASSVQGAGFLFPPYLLAVLADSQGLAGAVLRNLRATAMADTAVR